MKWAGRTGDDGDEFVDGEHSRIKVGHAKKSCGES